MLTVLSGHKIVVLGDREFCSVSLGKWLQKKSVYFCLRQKQSTNVKTKEGIYQEMRELGLSRGTQLFLNDVNITKEKGLGEFNLACKWEKTYRGFQTKEGRFKSELHHYLIYLYRIPHSGYDSQDIFEDDC
ncbi:hypothetical protein [Microcystis aeruginosa]|uniref:hypothetical protein n=1 Tax=Microcystis aeruginosa TaxID=1126 RepID=UPI003204D3B3